MTRRLLTGDENKLKRKYVFLAVDGKAKWKLKDGPPIRVTDEETKKSKKNEEDE